MTRFIHARQPQQRLGSLLQPLLPRQKYHRNRVYQVVGETGPGAIAVGYVRYSSELQDSTTIATQKRHVLEYAEKKGWKVVSWYEEPEQSTKYEEIEQRQFLLSYWVRQASSIKLFFVT